VHLFECNAHGVLVVPFCPSAAFWPLVFDANCSKKEFVKYLMFDKGQHTFVNNNNAVFSSRRILAKYLLFVSELFNAGSCGL